MTKKKEKIEANVTIDDVDRYLDKNPMQSVGWEEGTMTKWLNNPNFADFVLGCYAVWRHKDEILNKNALEIILPYLDRGVIYQYMDRLVKTKVAYPIKTGGGHLKAISPVYNESNQLAIRRYMRLAFISANHKEFDTRKIFSKQQQNHNNNKTTTTTK